MSSTVMSGRAQIDSVIDDDDEFCPLCIEEFDLSDKNFKPCPCGYQICQFCYNNIKTHNEEGRCPNCRRPYDESTIQYKVPDADEFKADLALKHRKAAAAKKKETEKREIEASSRKNLAGVRVVQKNLVYVIGLNPTIRDEAQLLQTLRGPDYFGQYGDIEKIVVSKAKPGGNPNQGIGVYVTFARKPDAATCIAAVDGSQNGDRLLRAQYGTTKYCSSFLRNEQCNNRNCTFLHETGDDSESYSRQDLSSMNTAQRHGFQNGTAAVAGQRPAAQPLQSQSMRRQGSKDEPGGKLPDGSALPSSASWANKDGPLSRTRRVSMSGSRSSPSPTSVNATVAGRSEESRRPEKQSIPAQDSRRSTPAPSQQQPPMNVPRARSVKPEDILLENLLKAVNSPDFRFVFSTDGLSDEDLKFIENGPSFIDPYGGVKRRAMREKNEQEHAKQEAETHALLQSAVVAEEETRESGSLQLGGEPEDLHLSRGPANRGRESHGAIQPPSQQDTASNSAVGSPVSINHQFQNLNLNTRSLTPLQQQQVLLLKSANGQQPGLMEPLQTSFDQTAQGRQGLFQGSMPPGSGLQGHTRQSSRFSFANDSNAKNASNARMLGQQASLMQSGTPNPLSAPAPQQGLSNQFYTSSVQGPPPGLKTAGTPPISGGGMFAQGHGFTTNTNLGLGGNIGKQEANPELMRELLRGRSGTAGTGGVQGHEAAKREFMFPFLQQHQTPPPLTPATGLLSAFYGSQAGTFAEPGPQKQKKKGKKHRHANTSSGGGGVVDLADPSILQARMHPVGVGASGQALYGSQGQVDEDEFPPLSTSSKDKNEFSFRPFLPHEYQGQDARSGTPSLPPGLPLPHGHPATTLFEDRSNPPSRTSSISFPAHAPPGLSVSRKATPIQKSLESVSTKQTRAAKDDSDDVVPTETTRNFGDISFGSPKMRQAKKNILGVKAEASAISEKDVPIGEITRRQDRAVVKKTNPIKLDLAMPSVGSTEAPAIEESSWNPSAGTAAVVPAPISQYGSRPNTPLTGISRNSDSSGPRQPRVFRVIDTPKTETPPPPPMVQSVASVAQMKVKSRRPSASSLSRPDTPADVGSDYDPATSTSASRANSPAPSRVGSAPVRSMTKNQVKKERRLKAKQAEEAKKDEVPAVAVEGTVQAPILGRKRKTKKATGNIPDQPAATSTSMSDATKLSDHADSSAADKDDARSDGEPKAPNNRSTKESRFESTDESDDKKTTEPWRSNNTMELLLKDAEVNGRPLKELFTERTSPLHVLLAQLHKAAEIDLNTHPLFNPPNINQRTDMKVTADDYDHLKMPIELSEEDRKRLVRGEAIRIHHGSDALKNRCLITPGGCVLRHLSAEEEDRYLELERRSNSDTFQDYPAIMMSEPDITNLNGGLDALFATPEKFDIHWVDDSQNGLTLDAAGAVLSPGDDFSPEMPSEPAPPNVLSAMEADTTRSHNWAISNSADHMNSAPAAVRSFAAATAKHLLGAAGIPIGDIPDIEDVQAMSDEELRSYIDRSQHEVETSRKDFDLIDKRFNALVKRNKKLAQQALTA